MQIISRGMLCFNEFALDLQRCALVRGDDRIQLRPKAFDVLRYLVEHSGRVVSKDELIQAVWRGVFVTDDSVVQCVCDIRKALRDDAQRTVKTLPRRGYIFATQVTRKHADEHAPTSGLRSRLQIAVLPFSNLTGDPSQDCFAEGITEDIVTELSRFHDLRVRTCNVSFQARGKAPDARRAGLDLDFEYVVDGSVRRLGDRIRIAVQLLEAASGGHLWAEHFDRDQRDISAVQDDVVRSLVGTLVGRLEAAGAERATRKPPVSLIAYDYVLRGNALPVGDVVAEAEARRMYEKAIELDASYGFPHAMLAFLLSLAWSRDMTGSDAALDRALELAREAVRLEYASSDCAIVLAWVHLNRRTFDLAEQCYRRALELNPNNPFTLSGMGDLLGYVGRPDEAIEWYRQARLVDLHFRGGCLGAAHFNARQYDEAIAAASNSPTLSLWRAAYLAASYALTSRIERARECAVEVLRRAPDFSTSRFISKEPYRRAADRDHLHDGLRQAGLPE